MVVAVAPLDTGSWQLLILMNYWKFLAFVKCKVTADGHGREDFPVF
jgi:hypothetical protein